MQGMWKQEADGSTELYPQCSDFTDDIEKYVIGNYKCIDERTEINTAVVNTTAVSLVKEMEQSNTDNDEIIYGVDDINLNINSITQNVRYRYKPSKVVYNINKMLNGDLGRFYTILLGGILFYVVITNVSKLNGNLEKAVFNGIITVILGGGLLGCFKAFLHCYLHGLKTYGFDIKDETVYVINNKKSIVEEAIIKSVHIANKTFQDTIFICEINGIAVNINGDDIYFTKSDAMCVMRSVLEINDTELKRYYPDWINDKKFVKYYNSTLPHYGFARNTKGNTNLLCVAATINGIKYKCDHNIQELFQTYLTYVKKQQSFSQEQKNLIEEIKAYHDNI